MKLYLKARNKFFKLSVLLLIIALVLILKFNLLTFGNFLLGLFASTIIITIQYNLSSKVEESKLLINALKEARNLCFKFEEFNTFSVDYFAIDFEDRFKEFKNRLEYLFKLNQDLGNNTDLSKKTKKELKKINEKISKLELDLYFIFKNFNHQTTKLKIIYFMEFYKILKDFNFEELQNMISDLGWKIDSQEFYKSDFNKERKQKIKELEYITSIQVYNKKLEENNSIEYKSLKGKFERFMK